MQLYKIIGLIVSIICLTFNDMNAQTVTETQKINARATGYAIVAARNPGVDFSIIMVPWDGVNTLEQNANNQINGGWHAQAAVKGNYFYQAFDGTDFSGYSSVVVSQVKFDQYKDSGTEWWIVCSTLPPFSSTGSNSLSGTQMQNARATGYAVVAARNPGVEFSMIMIPWDGTNTLEYNANTQINGGWHPQAVIKGNYFSQSFDGTNFSNYSSVLFSQNTFDQYKDTGTQWWIACSTLPSFSENYNAIGQESLWSSSGNNAFYDSGLIGIRTNSPDKALTVNGTVHSKEVLVDMAGALGPDYVFEPDYDLLTLSEIKSFIEKEKHLPEVPSAADMEADGINLKEMNLLLLKKAEELTLHTIKQQEEMDKMKKEIQILKNN